MSRALSCPMPPRKLAWVIVLGAITWGVRAHATDTTRAVFDGVTMTTRTTTTPWVIHVLKVDLTKPGVHLGATASAARRQTTSSYARSVAAAAAVNGDFFSYTDYSTVGLAAGGGAPWSDTHDTSLSANLVFDDAKRIELHDRSQVLAFDSS